VLYDYRGMRRLQHEAIFAVRLEGRAPEVQSSQRDAFEQSDLFDARWWTVNDIIASDEWFYPRSLPTLLNRFLSGDSIEEPLEVWDKTAWSAPAVRPSTP
jgi:hypothetical protein